ncbi:hypothetical protein KC345_g2433 [Hortaea werneckii]|nr:hypothetical protein KC345_g2433 [Hortaea werneckii]
MRFVGSGSGLISVSTPERCPGCNIAGYANGTSPRSSSAPGVQTVSVTYTTIQTRTETATSIKLLHNSNHHGCEHIERDFDDNYSTNHYPTSVDGHFCLNIQDSADEESCFGTTTVVTYTSEVPASTQTNTRTQTQLTTVTYVSTQPTTVISTYISTQPASTNTATVTQRITVVSTYQTTSVVTQTQTSTAPGIHGRANTNTTDHCPRDQRGTRPYTDNYIDPAHDLCLDFHNVFSIYDDIARCNDDYCFLGDIDLEYYNCVYYDNYNPGDSHSTWHDHPGDNDTAWRNSRFNPRPNRFRTYGNLHHSQHQLRRRTRDLCDPNSCVCPNVEQLRVSAIVFGIDSTGFFFGFSHITRRLVCAVTDIFLGFLEFLL